MASENASFHHAGLPVADLERAVAWYRDVLGLQHTTTATVPEGVEIAFVVDASGSGVELFALDAPAAPAWDGPIAALRQGTAHVAFVADPDGNLVELMSG